VGPVIWEKQNAVVKANNMVRIKLFMMMLDLMMNESDKDLIAL
jgi:hypothetical protein